MQPNALLIRQNFIVVKSRCYKTEHRKIEKRKKEEKVKRKKAPRVSSNKRGSQYFDWRKTLQLQRSFLM
jgi:hypothetical protein